MIDANLKIYKNIHKSDIREIFNFIEQDDAGGLREKLREKNFLSVSQ